MAEQLAENYHSAWAKRRKLEFEGRGTVSLCQLLVQALASYSNPGTADQLTGIYLCQEVPVIP